MPRKQPIHQPLAQSDVFYKLNMPTFDDECIKAILLREILR
ncbi:hypothetical protein [Helicobacter cinaedi]|nr:hypothetical protein [Helicobacter cinaedi]BBB19682.1 hypothetical protein HC081234_08590 [Helicobacter cinaedi]